MKQNAIGNAAYALNADTSVIATTFRTNPVTAYSSLAGTTLTMLGTDANVNFGITAKGPTGAINLTTNILANSAVPASGIVYRGIVAGGWSNSEWRTEQHTMQTVGAASTSILNIPLVNSLMVSVKILINGFKDDFTNCVGGEILATAYRSAIGDVTLVGAPIINVNYADPFDTSDIEADVDVPTQSLRLRVIGTAGDNWNWVATATYMYTISNV